MRNAVLASRFRGRILSTRSVVPGLLLCPALVGCGSSDPSASSADAPAPPPGQREKTQNVVRCGGQADNALAVLGAAVSTEYAKLDATKQAELCQGINDAAGWDVQQWAFAESGMAT